MAIILPTNFDVQTPDHLDKRLVVALLANRDTIPVGIRYWGMIVHVIDSTGGNDAETYILNKFEVDDDISNNSNWATLASSLTVGSDNQIPITNAGGTDFEYTSNFVYDGTKLDILYEDATTDTAIEVLKLQRTTSGTVANGIGASIGFYSEVTLGATVGKIGELIYEASDVDSTEAGKVTINLMSGDINTMTPVLVIDVDTGQTQIGVGADASTVVNSTVIGKNADVTGGAGGATSIGAFSKATGISNPSTAVGYSAYALGRGSTVIGYYAGRTTGTSGTFFTDIGYRSASTSTNIGTYSTAIGYIANAAGTHSVAIGSSADCSVSSSVAIGQGASVSGIYSVSIGFSAVASGQDAAAMGRSADASSIGSMALGYSTVASGNYTIALGYESEATAGSGIALGGFTDATGSADLAIGASAQATGTYGVAIGSSAITSTSASAIAIGRSAEARASRAISMGYFAGANSTGAFGDNAISIGTEANSVLTQDIGGNSIAIGLEAESVGDNSIALGTSSKSIASNSVAIGYLAEAESLQSISIGKDAGTNTTGAFGTNAISIGNGANSVATRDIGTNSVCLGVANSAEGAQAITIGVSSTTAGVNAISIGNAAIAGYQNAIAIGANATVTGTTGFAMGSAATANQSAVAIGASSDAAGTSSVAVGSTAETGLGAVSIGNASKGLGAYSVTVGQQAGSTAGTSNSYAISIGYQSNYSGTSQVIGTYGIALGSFTNTEATGTIAIGSYAEATASGAIIIGDATTAGVNVNSTADTLMLAWDGTSAMSVGKGVGMVLEAATGGDQGSGTINTKGVYVDGVASTHIQSASVQLTQAQIQALNTTPIEIIPTPGVGKYIQLVGASAFINHNGTTYAVASKLRLIYDGWTAIILGESVAAFISAPGDTVSLLATPVLGGRQLQLDKGIQAYADADATGAGGTIDVNIQYVIIDTN